MWSWQGDWGWGAWLVMSLGMLAFWTLVIWLFLNAGRTSQDAVTPSEREPEKTLANRFARGEIDEDEYHRRSDTLHASSR